MPAAPNQPGAISSQPGVTATRGHRTRKPRASPAKGSRAARNTAGWPVQLLLRLGSRSWPHCACTQGDLARCERLQGATPSCLVRSPGIQLSTSHTTPHTPPPSAHRGGGPRQGSPPSGPGWQVLPPCRLASRHSLCPLPPPHRCANPSELAVTTRPSGRVASQSEPEDARRGTAWHVSCSSRRQRKEEASSPTTLQRVQRHITYPSQLCELAVQGINKKRAAAAGSQICPTPPNPIQRMSNKVHRRVTRKHK